jgi:hypothetical protein
MLWLALGINTTTTSCRRVAVLAEGLRPAAPRDRQPSTAWNRYSYVGNNPLGFTDPTRYSWFSNFFHAISTFFNRTFGVLFRQVPILGQIFEIAAVALCMGSGLTCAVTAAFARPPSSPAVTSGMLGTALRAGAIAAVMALAFYEVGNLTDVVNGSPIGSQL